MLLNLKRMTRSFLVVSFVLGQVAQADTLTPTRPDRGQSKTFFDIPNSGGRQEVCIIPRFLPNVKYSKDALETMKDLCSINVYASTLQAGQKPGLACQKDVSTNPGLNIFELDPDQLTSDCDDLDEMKAKDKLEKAGKYKQSTSCSYTPGILAYYHVSQALGKVANVPESVMRTFDVENHLDIIAQALPKIKDPTLNATVTSLQKKLKLTLPKSETYKDLIFADGLKESYGAFILNPNGEDKYSEMFIRPTPADAASAKAVRPNAQANLERAFAFKRAQPHFQLVKNPASISSLVSAQISNYDTLINMRDIADMIVIDTIMSQEDRFGNVAYQPFKAVLLKDEEGNEKIELFKPKKYGEKVKELEANGFQILGTDDVKQMILKDNDCSVSRTNILAEAGLAGVMSHIDPKTYKNLLKFNASLEEKAVKDIFRVDFYFTEGEFVKMKKAANELTKLLQARCRSKALKLDLDIEGYLETGKVPEQTPEMCELSVE